MRNFKSAFTMIELVFVIVILGILAAIAIPKLAATRDDAKIAKGATELATAVADIASYYTAQGTLGLVSKMTNVSFDDNTIDMNTTGNSVTYEGCISITSTATAGSVNADGINVKYTASSASKICKGIAAAAVNITDANDTTTDHNKSFVFGGTGAVL
ncbi:type II secretion system GspH family protein [bacterium]|nr:type II secretion system GspH family protein [bacterium]MBU1884286.1 type II secretion system GspH family protein [bacterium]